MSFTKEEAINLLGQTVEITQTIYHNYHGHLDFPRIPKGTQAEVYLVENSSEGITISLLVDEVLEQFDKDEFNQHCLVLKS